MRRAKRGAARLQVFCGSPIVRTFGIPNVNHPARRAGARFAHLSPSPAGPDHGENAGLDGLGQVRPGVDDLPQTGIIRRRARWIARCFFGNRCISRRFWGGFDSRLAQSAIGRGPVAE
jgi:hypothetical protein